MFQYKLKVLNIKSTVMEDKLIVYDGNCGLCTSLHALMLQLAVITSGETSPYQQLQPKLKELINADRFRNEMALIDRSGGNTLYGAEGVAYILSAKSPFIRALFSIGFVITMFRYFYKFIAYNRYLIAPSSKALISCDCYPKAPLFYRLLYIVFTLLISVSLTAWFGITLRHYVGVSATQAALQMLLMAGTGWVLLIAYAFARFSFTDALAYTGHLGTIMVAGLLVLLPSIFLSSVLQIQYLTLPLLSVMCSSSIMLYFHHKRVQHLNLSKSWNVLWFTSLQLGAISWVLFFYY
jgi:predicted DCC family thiol-disulfide oxidoreductase YuxK